MRHTFAWLVLLFPITLIADWDPATLAQEVEKIQQDYELVGLSVALVSPEQHFSYAVGLADKAKAEVLTPSHRMLAASIGKMFVAANALKLVEAGKLQLDTPVATWFADEPRWQSLANHQQITLRQLLSHRSGLANHVETPAFQTDFVRLASQPDPNPLHWVFDYLAGQPALAKPDQAWHYSDSGYILAAYVMEKADGRTIFRQIDARFLQPLQLTQTEASNRRDLANLANGYLAKDNPMGLPQTTLDNQGIMRWHPGAEGAGGGLVSNPSDLANWLYHLMNGEVLSQDGLAQMLNSLALQPQSQSVDYGLGMAHYQDPSWGDVYGHGGWIPGYVSSMRYYARPNISIAFQINTDTGLEYRGQSVVKLIEQRLIAVATKKDE